MGFVFYPGETHILYPNRVLSELMEIIENPSAPAPQHPGKHPLRMMRIYGLIPTSFCILVGSIAVSMAALAFTPVSLHAESLKEAAANIIRNKGCAACHYVPGVPEAMGRLGPSLKNLSKRVRIVGGQLENTPDNMRDWLKNPKEVKPSTMMPNLGLSDREIEILLEFFQTL